jgi:hypothetical protein
MDVKCPYCHREIDNGYVRSEVARQMGKSKSPRKKSKEEMSRLGKLGAKKRWKKEE